MVEIPYCQENEKKSKDSSKIFATLPVIILDWKLHGKLKYWEEMVNWPA